MINCKDIPTQILEGIKESLQWAMMEEFAYPNQDKDVAKEIGGFILDFYLEAEKELEIRENYDVG